MTMEQFGIELDLLSLLTTLSSVGHFCDFLNQTSKEVFEAPLPIQSPDCHRILGVYLPRASLCAVLAAICALYCLYYLLCAVSMPSVVCGDRKKLERLRQSCPAIFEKFWPTPWAPQAHMQTIIRVAIQTYPSPERRREVLKLKDGGHVCLDWYNEVSPEQPTVLMLPGATGSSDENYVRHWIDDMIELGYRSVVFNYRGCGDNKLSTPRIYSCTDIEDLQDVLSHVSSLLPRSPVMAVGASLGTILLVKYITECKRSGQPCLIKSAMLISVIWNFPEADISLHKALNKQTLNRYLCNNLKKLLKHNRPVFDEYRRRGQLCFDYEKAIKCNYFRDFMEFLIIPMFGYQDHTHVYRDTSPHLRVSDIHIPVVTLNAADDPFCPKHSIPEEAALRNPNLVLVTTRKGGHIGFMEGFLPVEKTLMDRILMQFASSMFTTHKKVL